MERGSGRGAKLDEATGVADAKQPPVLVVILNWNCWEDTLTAVESVLRLNYRNHRILVIDNGSTDGSVPHLRNIRNERVEILENLENLGFTGGCNEGFRRGLKSGASYIWLLNSDALIEEENILSSLVELAESNPKIGLVSPRLAEPGEAGHLTFCGGVCQMNPFYFERTADPKEALGWVGKYPNAGFVSGAAVLVKASLIREIGMLDEKFFAYIEATDFSYRSSKAGYKNLVDENSLVRHAQKNMTLNPLTIKPHFWYYMARNECLLWRKHMGVIRALRPSWWAFRRMTVHLCRCREAPHITEAILAGLWHGWTNRGGPYRPEYRMPRTLADAVWKYALAKAKPLHFVRGTE